MPTIVDTRHHAYQSDHLIVFDKLQGLAIEDPTKKMIIIGSIDGIKYGDFLNKTPKSMWGPMAGMAVVPPKMQEQFLANIVFDYYSPLELFRRLKRKARLKSFADRGVLKKLSDAEKIKIAEYILGLAPSDLNVANILFAALPEVFHQAAAVPAPPPSLALEGITPEQMEGWRAVNAARSRAQRANLTSEQVAHQTKQAAKRVAAFRERMTPEQRDVRNAKAAEHMRKKRALAKAPQP